MASGWNIHGLFQCLIIFLYKHRFFITIGTYAIFSLLRNSLQISDIGLRKTNKIMYLYKYVVGIAKMLIPNIELGE